MSTQDTILKLINTYDKKLWGKLLRDRMRAHKSEDKKEAQLKLISEIQYNAYLFHRIPMILADKIKNTELASEHKIMGELLRWATCAYGPKRFAYDPKSSSEINYDPDVGLITELSPLSGDLSATITVDKKQQSLTIPKEFFEQNARDYRLVLHSENVLMHLPVLEKEQRVADYLMKETVTCDRFNKVTEEEIEDHITAMQYEINPDLVESISQSLKQPVSVIKGEAGTGKTAAIQVIHRICDRYGITFRVAAFTGKAVENIQSKYDKYQGTDNYAMYRSSKGNFTTVHSLIYRVYSKIISDVSSGDCSNGEIDKPYVLVIEEASMVSTVLMNLLFSKIAKVTHFAKNHRVHLVLVGDEDQLPPIGWGRFFRSVIDSNLFVISTLVNNYRLKTATGKLIINNARRFRGSSGDKWRKLDTLDNCFETDKSPDLDNYIRTYYSTVEDYKNTQFISPTNRRCTVINTRSQELLRKGKDSFMTYSYFDQKTWYENDKVVILKNCATQDVYNGSGGVITSLLDVSVEVRSSPKELPNLRTYSYLPKGGSSLKRLIFKASLRQDDDGRIYLLKNGEVMKPFIIQCAVVKIKDRTITVPVVYDISDDEDDDEEEEDEPKAIYMITMEHIGLAYCITTHKSQGSEYETVLYDCTGSGSSSLSGQESNVYTALTRTKSKVIYLGHEAVICKVPPLKETHDRLPFLLCER